MDIANRLKNSNLRPTRQRIALAELLFAKGDRHVSAELLFDEAIEAGFNLSLATVYNTLHQFTNAGMLRAISVDSARTYFDTNTGDHHHFFVEGEEKLIDMPDEAIEVANLPTPPEGMEISRVDVVVRIKPAG